MYEELDDATLVEMAKRSRAGRVRLAREDPAEFCAFILRDEETGGPIANAPFHLDMHRTLDASSKTVLLAHVESGKSQQITIGRTIHKLGRSPDRRIVIVSAVDRQARKFVKAIADHIEHNPRVREVFPQLRPGRYWETGALTVAESRLGAKDPNVQAAGLHGAVIGTRADDLIFDDALNLTNIRTEEQCEETERWVKASFSGRLTRRSTQTWLGTAWVPGDPMQRRLERRGWVGKRYPVRDRLTGVLNWPERWPVERIEAAEEEFEGAYSTESCRQLYVEARGDEDQKFEEASLDRALAEGLAANVGLVYSLSTDERDAIVRDGGIIIVGVDPASGRRKRKRVGAKTAFFVLLVYGNGDRQVLWAEAGKYGATVIRDKLIDFQLRYGASVYVEDNGVQDWLLDIVGEKAAIPILTWHTGLNKHDPTYGVQSMDAEMLAGKWLVPSEWVNGKLQPDGVDLRDWFRDMRSFRPGKHTGDLLMASWIAREGARLLLGFQGGGVSASIV